MAGSASITPISFQMHDVLRAKTTIQIWFPAMMFLLVNQPQSIARQVPFMETGLISRPHTPSSFEARRSLRASLTAIFDIRIEHLRFVFEEDQEPRIERIYRAIWDNGRHHHWDSASDMYRFYEGFIRDRYPHLFSRGQRADDESDCPPADHSGALTTEAMMRDVTTTQSVGNAFGDDIIGHSIEQPSADVRNEYAGMSLSSNAGSFGDGNDVTTVAPIDAIAPHPESYSSGDEDHRRTAADEERDRVLHKKATGLLMAQKNKLWRILTIDSYSYQ